MSLDSENFNWYELKGKAKRQLKNLQRGHLNIFGNQPSQQEIAPEVLDQCNQVRAETQLSDLLGLLKVMNKHQQNDYHSSKTGQLVNQINSSKSRKLLD